MTPLAAQLVRQIELTGPITIADYMAACLSHPDFGYYTTRNPFGAAGDFVTAPEISQMFGELIGLAMAQAWCDQGCPAPFVLAELGPGRGTLMADILRAAGRVPGFSDGLQVHLVEVSPGLRAAQARALPRIAPIWHDRVDSLPEAPLVVVANEFFDALPIRQFQRGSAGWSERQVGVRDGRLAFGLAAETPLDDLEGRLVDTAPGDIVETCPATGPVVAALSTRIAQNGGAALIVDYGGWRSRGDTLQAVRAHAFVDPLDAPGEADLTAHVDFESLSRAARSAAPLAVSAMTSQGVFLERLGITHRAKGLARNLTGDALATHIAAHRRLTHPEEMGSLFKCVALTALSAPPFPGLPT